MKHAAPRVNSRGIVDNPWSQSGPNKGAGPFMILGRARSRPSETPHPQPGHAPLSPKTKPKSARNHLPSRI